VQNEKKKKHPKRQVLLICQYLGTGYHGSTWNTDKPAIENTVHDAIAKAGGIEEKRNLGDMKKLNWSRSSRTDKGVHAALNVFSMRISMFDDTEKMIIAINGNLSDTIRIVDIKRGTKKFNARSACSSRLYNYLLPSYLLSKGANGEDGSFRISEEELKATETLWQLFAGTHAFHNFTKGMQHKSKGVKRHIKELKCSRKIVEGAEYVLFFLHGQSFLFNQIRKMVGYMVASARAKLPDDANDIVFGSGNFKVPLAPAEGLFLDSSLFERHNVKMRNINQEERQVHMDKYEEKKQTFIDKYIHPEIAKSVEVFSEYKTFIDEEYEWQEKEYQPKKSKIEDSETKESKTL